MEEQELKPKSKRGKTTEGKAEEVEMSETLLPPTEEEPPVLISDPNYLAALEAAQEVFGNDVTPETKIQIETTIKREREAIEIPLAQKIIHVMAAIDFVEKKGRNEAQKYDYQRAVDVTREVRREFIKRGILLITSITEMNMTQIPRDRGSPNILVDIRGKFIVTDGREIIEFEGAGMGQDVGDKGIYKAITGMLKYGLRALLLLPDERDDPEVTRPDEVAETQIVIGKSEITNVIQGGRQQVATQAQIAAIREASRELNLVPEALNTFIQVELGRSADLSGAADVNEGARLILDFLSGLTFEECGKIVRGLMEAVETNGRS